MSYPPAFARQASPAAARITELIANPKFAGFFTATVRGFDEDGVEFEANVPLDGHLDGDLYLKLSHHVPLSSTLFIVLRLVPGLTDSCPTLRIAVHGKVNRINLLPGGKADLRIAVLDYQSL